MTRSLSKPYDEYSPSTRNVIRARLKLDFSCPECGGGLEFVGRDKDERTVVMHQPSCSIPVRLYFLATRNRRSPKVIV